MEKENSPKPDELISGVDPMRESNVSIVTPAQLLQIAVSKGTDLAQLEKLMDLNERFECDRARKSFVNAMTKFKANPPTILKDTAVSFGNTHYSHATLDQVSDKIGQALAEHGLSHRWSVEQTDKLISVTCIITHIQGHSESVTMTAPADSSGSKNPIQAIGSSVSYLQRYTLLSASGCAVKGMDDDGRLGKTDPTPARQPTAPSPTQKKTTIHIEGNVNQIVDGKKLSAMKNAELRKVFAHCDNAEFIVKMMHDNVDLFVMKKLEKMNILPADFDKQTQVRTGKSWIDLNITEKEVIADGLAKAGK